MEADVPAGGSGGELTELADLLRPCMERVRSSPFHTGKDPDEVLEELSAGRAVPERRAILGDLAENEKVVDYLAARRIARRYPAGPQWWRPTTLRFLRPRTRWPWPDAGMKLFLAALWRESAPAAVDRQLRRLLTDRFRDPNIRFVIELSRRSLLPEGALREELAQAVRKALSDAADERLWEKAIEWARAFDPAMAVEELSALVFDPARDLGPRHRFAAVKALLAEDPERGAMALAHLAENLSGSPEDRLATAVLIREVDKDVGARALRLLATSRDMRKLRVDAALAAGSPDLLFELAAHDSSIRGDGRLRLAAKLLEGDPGRAAEALRELVAGAGTAETVLGAAKLIAPVDRELALTFANGVAWPDDGKPGGDDRFAAVVVVGEIAPERAVAELEKFAADTTASYELRVEAAERIVAEHGGPIDALVALSRDPDVGPNLQMRVAAAIGKVDREAGARIYIQVARTRRMTSAGHLEPLRKAYELKPGLAAKALSDVARDERASAAVRLRAVQIAGSQLAPARKIELYEEIAKTTNGEDALAAAEKVAELSAEAGERAFAALTERAGTGDRFRLTAARQAGAKGRESLLQLARGAGTDQLRLEAAQALRKVDNRRGEAELRRLATKARSGKTRIEAARNLPGKKSVDALIEIVEDRHEKDDIRFEAGREAERRNRRRGQDALLDCAENPRTSRSLANRIRRHLGA